MENEQARRSSKRWHNRNTRDSNTRNRGSDEQLVAHSSTYRATVDQGAPPSLNITRTISHHSFSSTRNYMEIYSTQQQQQQQQFYHTQNPSDTQFISTTSAAGSYNQQQQQQQRHDENIQHAIQRQQRQPVNAMVSPAASSHANPTPHQEHYFQPFYHYAHHTRSNPTRIQSSLRQTASSTAIQHFFPHHNMQNLSLYGSNYPAAMSPRSRSTFMFPRNVSSGSNDRQQQQQQQLLITATTTQQQQQSYADSSSSSCSSSPGSGQQQQQQQQRPSNVHLALEQAASAPSLPQHSSPSPARGRPPRRRPSYPVLNRRTMQTAMTTMQKTRQNSPSPMLLPAASLSEPPASSSPSMHNSLAPSPQAPVERSVATLEDELQFLRDEWTSICIVLNSLRNAFMALMEARRNAEERNTTASSSSSTSSPSPSSNHPQHQQQHTSSSNVATISTEQQQHHQDPPFFQLPQYPLTPTVAVPSFYFSVSTPTLSTLAAGSPEPSASSSEQRSNKRGRRDGAGKEQGKRGKNDATSNTAGAHPDVDREMLTAYDDVVLQLNQLETKVQQLESAIRTVISSRSANFMTATSTTARGEEGTLPALVEQHKEQEKREELEQDAQSQKDEDG